MSEVDQCTEFISGLPKSMQRSICSKFEIDFEDANTLDFDNLYDEVIRDMPFDIVARYKKILLNVNP